VSESGIGAAAVGVKQQGIQVSITAASTEAAKKWQGWGTALKPAVEPIVLARKPLIGTVAENVLTHGTGALNIDASRIGTDDRFGGGAKGSSGFATGYESEGWVAGSASGRWPANILLDEEAAALLDEQSGERQTGEIKPYTRDSDNRVYSGVWGNDVKFAREASTGGASRFFYVAKASRAERNAGTWQLKKGHTDFGGKGKPGSGFNEVTHGTVPKLAANIHPTVKPVDLMRYLIRLVTPKGGTVLDPFMGSGTTAVAAIGEGVNWIGCEREPEYVAIIEARIAAAQPGMGLNLKEDTQ
jgi:site-specific DNA-methyltransferase (adenine-specific)